MILLFHILLQIMKSEKTTGSNLNAATKRQKTILNDTVPKSSTCTALYSKINDTNHTDKINRTLNYKTININGKDFKNHEVLHDESIPKSGESCLDSNEWKILNVNFLETKNRKTDCVNLLRNKVHEKKLEDDQFIADRENEKNGVREKYNKWKESMEKKRKLRDVVTNSHEQPLCDFHSN